MVLCSHNSLFLITSYVYYVITSNSQKKIKKIHLTLKKSN